MGAYSRRSYFLLPKYSAIVGFAIDCKYCLCFFDKGFVGIFPDLVLGNGSAYFWLSNFLLSLWNFRTNCSVCCTILSCGSFPELSRSKSLTSIFVSWTWSTLSRCICRVLSMILDSSGISRGTVDIPLACWLKATGEDCLFSWVEVANAANNSLSFASDVTDCFRRLSIWAINPCSNPLTDPSHQTQFATKICWVLLACAIIFSRAYTRTALLFSKVIVI